MAFKPKRDAAGAFVWKDEKPVFTNTETGSDLDLDVDKLFADNATLRNEAKTNRERYEAAETSLKTFEGLDPAKAKTAIADAERLRQELEKGGGKAKAPTQDELDDMVKERYQASLTQMSTDLETTKTRLTAAEKARDTFQQTFHNLKLETECHAAALKANILPEAYGDVVRYVKESWKLDEKSGRPVKYGANGQVVGGTDPSIPLTMEEDFRILTAGPSKHWIPRAQGSEHIIPGNPGGAAGEYSKNLPTLASQLFTVTTPAG